MFPACVDATVTERGSKFATPSFQPVSDILDELATLPWDSSQPLEHAAAVITVDIRYVVLEVERGRFLVKVEGLDV